MHALAVKLMNRKFSAQGEEPFSECVYLHQIYYAVRNPFTCLSRPYCDLSISTMSSKGKQLYFYLSAEFFYFLSICKQLCLNKHSTSSLDIFK